MSAAELARKLDVPTNRVTGILNGRRAVTGDTALRLAHFFGTSAEFWLNLQSLYELRLAQNKVGKAIRALPRLRRPERVPAGKAVVGAGHKRQPGDGGGFVPSTGHSPRSSERDQTSRRGARDSVRSHVREGVVARKGTRPHGRRPGKRYPSKP
jgi:addiction module HigA family antidote